MVRFKMYFNVLKCMLFFHFVLFITLGSFNGTFYFVLLIFNVTMDVRTSMAYKNCNNSSNLGLLIFFKRIMFYFN